MSKVKRIGTKVLVLIILTCLCACGPSETEKLKAENEDLRSQVSQLQSKVDDVTKAAEKVKSDAQALKSASDELQAQLARFNSENWRDVVPAAKSAGDDVEEKSSALDSSLSDLDDATDD